MKKLTSGIIDDTCACGESEDGLGTAQSAIRPEHLV